MLSGCEVHGKKPPEIVPDSRSHPERARPRQIEQVFGLGCKAFRVRSSKPETRRKP